MPGRSLYARLIKRLKRTFPDADLEVVRKAYRMSADGHLGQQRASGEAYITHPVNVALILAEMGLDPVTCAAALLHDLLEDTKTPRAAVEAEFGEAVARVVEGVTKITRLNFREDSEARENRQAQNIRKLLVATAQDLRVILIKLADRLHNMRTLEFLSEEKRVSIARETMDIYAPLAHRLGISEWRWELEDHAFHILDPESYKEVAKAVSMKRREREIYLRQTITLLDKKLAEVDIPARVIGRPKHLFSIHEKIKSQNKDFSQVYDVLGVRIITQSEGACYSALGVVHSLWPPLPDRVKDYVAVPKENMYQAIHTTVVRENGRPMEVQIRSEAMDRVAREGVAAHWVYKEGGRDDALDARLIWLRRLHDWLKDEDIGDGLMDSMRQEINPRSYVYVYTPKGDVIELPEGATPLDLAYHVHSHVGHHCLGARVNEKMVSLRYNLQNGDVVEILTSKNQEPHRDWLDLVITGRARTRIRQRLRELGELPPLAEEKKPEARPRTAHHPGRAPLRPETVREVDDATRHKLIRIEGHKGMAVQFAKCCNPMPGNRIVGYVTRNPGISVHRVDCRSFLRTAQDPKRVVEAAWEGDSAFVATLCLETRRRPNLLADITNVLRPMNIDITGAHFAMQTEDRSDFVFSFETPDDKTITRVLQTALTVPGVFDARQVEVKALPAGPGRSGTLGG